MPRAWDPRTLPSLKTDQYVHLICCIPIALTVPAHPRGFECYYPTDALPRATSSPRTKGFALADPELQMLGRESLHGGNFPPGSQDSDSCPLPSPAKSAHIQELPALFADP